jgi:uncharacterized membrane protein YjgN (DUF898 family)
LAPQELQLAAFKSFIFSNFSLGVNTFSIKLLFKAFLTASLFILSIFLFASSIFFDSIADLALLKVPDKNEPIELLIEPVSTLYNSLLFLSNLFYALFTSS